MEKLTFAQIEGYLVKCVGCEKMHLPLTEIHKGRSYCVSCKEKVAKCSVTDEYHLKDEMHYFEAQGIWVFEPNQMNVEKSCVSRKNIYLGTLKKSASKEKQIKIRDDDDGIALLEEFERNDYVELHNSRYTKRKNVFNWGGLMFRRETAVEELVEQSKVVSNYSHKPEPLFKKTIEKTVEYTNAKGEKITRGIPYLGFELEMSCVPTSSGEPDENGRYESISSNDRDRMKDASVEMLKYIIDNKLEEMLYFKQDGSVVNGWETVSHPCTLSFWKTINFREYFDKLKSLGMNEHDSCGLHIHVSRDALTPKEWWTLVSFMSKVSNKIIKLSRRSRERLNYCKWGSSEGLIGALAEGKNVFNVFPNQMHRESAINFKPKHTVEFRLFKSTASAEELLGSMAMVESMVMFAKEYSFMYVQDARTSDIWKEYVAFVKKLGYGNLIKLMENQGVLKSKIKKTNVVCA